VAQFDFKNAQKTGIHLGIFQNLHGLLVFIHDSPYKKSLPLRSAAEALLPGGEKDGPPV
jgi:hypothetical protein